MQSLTTDSLTKKIHLQRVSVCDGYQPPHFTVTTPTEYFILLWNDESILIHALSRLKENYTATFLYIKILSQLKKA